MIIKVCGMREAGNIREAEALGVDWIGMIFWPHSKRGVTVRPDYLPVRARRVGVFVDETIDVVRQTADDYALDLIQLHGSEPPSFLSAIGRRTIKAFNIASAGDLRQTEPYEGIADYFLFDTKGKSVGGNGEKFDWSILSDYHGSTPFLLSGGIGPDDAERVKKFHHPLFVGIDLNSRFERMPGEKDITRLEKFIKTIRQ